jgi:hypothetical protein
MGAAIVDALVTAAVLAVPLLSYLLYRTRRALARAIAAQNDLVKLVRSLQLGEDAATPTEVSDEITAPIELPRGAS